MENFERTNNPYTFTGGYSPVITSGKLGDVLRYLDIEHISEIGEKWAKPAIKEASSAGAVDMANDILKAFGINQLWSAKAKKTGTHAAGRTNWSNREVTFSPYYDGVFSKEEWENAVFHEVAHVLAGYKADHNAEWLKIGQAIGMTSGARVALSKEQSALRAKNSKWTVVCPTCGSMHGFARRPSRFIDKKGAMMVCMETKECRELANKAMGNKDMELASKISFKVIQNW